MTTECDTIFELLERKISDASKSTEELRDLVDFTRVFHIKEREEARVKALADINAIESLWSKTSNCTSLISVDTPFRDNINELRNYVNEEGIMSSIESRDANQQYIHSMRNLEIHAKLYSKEKYG